MLGQHWEPLVLPLPLIKVDGPNLHQYKTAFNADAKGGQGLSGDEKGRKEEEHFPIWAGKRRGQKYRLQRAHSKNLSVNYPLGSGRAGPGAALSQHLCLPLPDTHSPARDLQSPRSCMQEDVPILPLLLSFSRQQKCLFLQERAPG